MWYPGADSMTVTISDPVSDDCPGDYFFTCSTGDGFDGVSTPSGVILCDAPGGVDEIPQFDGKADSGFVELRHRRPHLCDRIPIVP